jgi:DNA-binding transcriptional regulator YhcF (GntR family)
MRFEASFAPAFAVRGPHVALQDPPNIRAVARVAGDFFLKSMDNMVHLSSGELIQALIFTAMWSANVRHITQSCANLKFGGRGDIPPDDLRLPVSVTALSSSLRIPYETVRRHVSRLQKEGQCVHVGRPGYIVPASVHAESRFDAIFDRVWEDLLQLLSNLKRSEFDFAPYRAVLPNTVPVPPRGVLPANIRALSRVVAEIILRGLDTLGMQHDDNFLDGLIYTAIVTANGRHIISGRDNIVFGGLAQLPPDAMRRPVTVHALASMLRVPYETARRAANRLVARGTAVRIGGKGLIVPRAQLMRPECYLGIQHSYAHIVRLIANMHRAGLNLSGY